MSTNHETKVNGVTYRQLTRKCGKPGCKCTMGQEHGPYWYAFGDNSAAKYVGVNLPEHVTRHAELLKAALPKLKALEEKAMERRDKARDALAKADDELRTLRALRAGEWTDARILKSLGLAQFNGQMKGG